MVDDVAGIGEVGFPHRDRKVPQLPQAGLGAQAEVVREALKDHFLTGRKPVCLHRSHKGLGPGGYHIEIGREELVAKPFRSDLVPCLIRRRALVHIAVWIGPIHP